jgi:hypothetical protein
MQLAFDLESFEWVNPVNFRAALASISLRRGDAREFVIIPTRNGQRAELPHGATATLQLNAAGVAGDAGKLADDTTATALGFGNESAYAFTLDVSGAEVDALFAANETEVSASLALRIESGALREATPALPVTLENYVIETP